MNEERSNFQQLNVVAVDCRAGGSLLARVLLPWRGAGRTTREAIPSPFNPQRAFHFPPDIDNYPSAIFLFWKHRKYVRI